MKHLLMGIALLTFALILVSGSTAGYGRFDSPAKITHSGLKVSGPFSLDADELGAVVHATVVQNGQSASGDSAYFSGSSWSATLSGGSFVAGAANAKGKATVYLAGGGTEQYTWTERIQLAP